MNEQIHSKIVKELAKKNKKYEKYIFNISRKLWNKINFEYTVSTTSFFFFTFTIGDSKTSTVSE